MSHEKHKNQNSCSIHAIFVSELMFYTLETKIKRNIYDDVIYLLSLLRERDSAQTLRMPKNPNLSVLFMLLWYSRETKIKRNIYDSFSE